MCPIIFSAIAGGLSSLAGAAGLSGVSATLGGLSTTTGLAKIGTLAGAAAGSSAATSAGLTINGMLLSALGTGVSTGLSVRQAKLQQEAAKNAAESAQESAKLESHAVAENLGRKFDIAARVGDRRARAARAAEATTNIILAGRNVTGNTRRQMIRQLRADRLEAEDAAKRGLIADASQSRRTVQGISAQRDRIINSLPVRNPAAIGVGGAFDMLGDFNDGFEKLLPVIA